MLGAVRLDKLRPGPSTWQICMPSSVQRGDRAIRFTASAGSAAQGATGESKITAPVNVRSSSVTIGKTTVGFVSVAPIASVLQTYVDLNGPKEFASQGDLYAYLRTAARTLITDKIVQAQFPTLVRLLDAVRAEDRVVGARGIAVGGRGMTELRIRNNSIDSMQQGITAGVSYKQVDLNKLPSNVARQPTIDSMMSVAISGNIINNVLIPITKTKARWAIFVGNAASISIEQNDVSSTVSGTDLSTEPLRNDGIRVWGYLGHKLLICKNQVTGFANGVFVRALNASGPIPGQTYWIIDPPSATSSDNNNLWLVSDNYIAGSVIVAPACTLDDNWPQPIQTTEPKA